MRIPPIHKSAYWQRFLGGVAVGAIIGWSFFLFTYGHMQERQVEVILKQKQEIQELKKDIEIWRNDYHEWNQKQQKQLILQNVKITFSNEEQLDSLTSHALKESIKQDLRPLLKKDIESIANHKELIFKAIENKQYHIDEQTYEVRIAHLYLFTTLELHLIIKQIN